MTLYTELKHMFKSPTPLQKAANELADAEIALLEAETGAEYAQSMVTYNCNRVKRLKAYLAAPKETL